MIAPHRRNTKKKLKTQDGRKLRRYKRRSGRSSGYTRLAGELPRRLVIRYEERRAENYLGFVRLGCIVILLLRYL